MATAQETSITVDNTADNTSTGAKGAGTPPDTIPGTTPASPKTDPVPLAQGAGDSQNAPLPDKIVPSSTGNGFDIKDVIARVVQGMEGAIGPQSPAGPRSSKWLDDPTVHAVNTAFMLGWSIVELRCRLQIASDLVALAMNDKLETEFGNPLQFTSQWRALFARIATMQMAAFGDTSTKDTFYQPATGWFSLLPYLNQQPASPDSTPYYDIGLPTSTYSGSDGTIDTFTEFSLYQVSRRALNCLALLHVRLDPDEPLLSESLCSYTDPLFAALQMPLPPGDEQAAREQRRVDAITTVTSHIVQILDAWDGFLRENYYSGGAIPNDATEQTAYRAGSALAALSWNLSRDVVTMPVTPPSGSDVDQMVQLHAKWSTAFAEDSIASIQHQLAALATVLDDAYYRLNPAAKPAASDGTTETFDPDLPSEVLSCLSRSLEFWQKAVAWLDPKPAATPTPQKAEQAHPLTPELATSLHAALTQQSAMWQDLITGQQTMDAYGVETVMHAVINDLFDRFRQDVQHSLQQTTRGALEETLRRVVIPLGLAILVLSAPAFIWLAIAHPTLSSDLSANGLWAVLGLGPAIGGILSVRTLGSPARGSTASTTNVTASASASTPSAAPASQNATPGAYLQGMMSNVSATVIEMLQAAMKQVRLDLAALNHEVGITYPLLECFVNSRLPGLSLVNQDYDFMTQVIWSGTERQEEIENVVRAAFGPLGILIKTQIEKDAPAAAGALPPGP